MSRIFAILIALLAAASSRTAANTFFLQQPINATPARISDWSHDRQKADDFILPGGSRILTRISWWGSYAAGDAPAADDFVFQFFLEDPGRPGFPFTICDDERFPAQGDISRRPTGLVDSSGRPVYAYSALLDRPKSLAGNRRYWLSITASAHILLITPAPPDLQWSWLSSGGGSQYFRTGHCPECAEDWSASNTGDLAFALETLPRVGIGGRSAAASIIDAASSSFLFTVWGKATVAGSGGLDLSDGSGQAIQIESPGAIGFSAGDYLKATGFLSRSATGIVLKADAADVMKAK